MSKIQKCYYLFKMDVSNLQCHRELLQSEVDWIIVTNEDDVNVVDYLEQLTLIDHAEIADKEASMQVICEKLPCRLPVRSFHAGYL